jgi:RimJ/RimL family protein N-acetyltransferase
MLDKTVPYIKIFMRRDGNKPLPVCDIPQGYRYVFYAPGDIASWAVIETSVGEFDTIQEAEDYFKKEFLPFEEELKRRMVFIETENGEKVATATAWWGYDDKRRRPTLHWVAVKPEHQGKRLGKAISSEVIRLIVEIEGEQTIYLHTQTWSHKAVVIYEWAGFIITDKPYVMGRANDRYDEAVKIINNLYGRDTYAP